MQADFLAFLTWYLVTSLAAVAALPLAFRLFTFLPDRGYAFARPLGLLATTYIFWLFVSLGFLRNDGGSVFVAAGVVLALGAFWLNRAGLADLRAWLAAQRSYVLGVEALFLAAFAVWAWVRAYNPDIAGTEKPMEFMFINSILRSESFPPNDAWLSGHPISYYYYGYVLMAALVKVTGVASSVAFNLGIALLFALACTGALGVGVNLIALAKADSGQWTEEDNLSEQPTLTFRLLPSFWPALLAPLFIVVAGNFYGVIALAHANGWAANLQIPAVYYDFGTPQPGVDPRFLSDFEQPPGARVGLVNVYEWLDLKGANTIPAENTTGQFIVDPGFWWWFSGARVTHEKNLTGKVDEAITEMPAFSFILGDMHPHVLGLPFVFIAIALALNWLLWAVQIHLLIDEPRETPRPWHMQLRATLTALFQPVLGSVLFTGWLLGGLVFMNTWDFPMYLFVVVAALAVGFGLAWGWDGLLKNWLVLAVFAGAVAVIGIGLFLPFYFTFQSQAGGILPNLIYPTRFQQTAVMFAHVLMAAVVMVIWLAWRGREVLDRRAAWWAGGGLLAGLILVATALTLGATLNPALVTFVEDALRPLALSEAFGLMLQRRLVDSFTSLLTASMVGLCVGLAIGVLRSRPTLHASRFTLFQPPTLFTLILLLTGAMLVLGPEFVYLRDGFGTRMNTIFKFYFQAWVMWGVAGAFGLWLLSQQARAWVVNTMTIIMSVAVTASLVYTLAGVYSKAGRFAGTPTLDGLTYFRNIFPNEWAAIQWLNANVTGTPHVMEAVGGSYSEYGRIAMGTGLPTVIGWPWHEWQWRGAKYFDEHAAAREGQVQEFYLARDWPTTLALLDKYNIQYVVVSDLERRKYNRIDTRRFEQYMRVAFSAGDLIIYERLDSASSR